MATDPNNFSIAAFTALGTIVGYLGAEVACDSIFQRLLWPSRFYNTTSLKSVLAISLLMTIGGPIHSAAIEALDKLAMAGLWKGYCRGDMLGTAFYEDSDEKYIMRWGEDLGKRKEARNAFWIRVLDLVPWRPAESNQVETRIEDDEAAGKAVEKVRARRPVFVLDLSRCTTSESGSVSSVVDGDIGGIKLRYFVALVASEFTTLSVGLFVAVLWHSLFSLWFLTPLLVKIFALIFQTRRESIAPNKEPDQQRESTPKNIQRTPNGKAELCICEAESIINGFYLIKGSPELVLQFFRHYGHPIRHGRGLQGDRAREISCMIVVILTAMIYPGGLIAFIFAAQEIQWVWLGYQLYAMLAMHFYRFSGGRWIGSTEMWLATELKNNKRVCFDSGNDGKVIARLESVDIVEKFSDGRQRIQLYLADIIGNSKESNEKDMRTSNSERSS